MPTPDIQSTGSVRRKVIFVFVTGAVALALAWVISRVAFTEMMGTVESITTPDPKLEMVSGISRDIMRLDQMQRAQAFGGNASYRSFSKESAAIVASLDSLKQLYAGSDVQQSRIDSIKSLLRQRDRLFNGYVSVREKVVDSREFLEQLQSLSDVIYEPSSDSTIVTTERKRRTTTIAGDTSAIPVLIDSDDRGFFGRLFGRKRQEQPPLPVVEERRMVEEEMETIVDTIRAVQHDSTLARIDSAVQRFQMLQQQQREQFVSREKDLTIVSNTLISNMLSILHSVENEAMQQMEVDNQQARAVVSDSVWRISAIILAFFIITAVMVYLILADIRRNNAYRVALEAAKEEAEYHAAAKQRFLANMSHELRTPLQSIIGYSEQLKQGQHAEDTKIDAIYQSSEHLLQIVNEILDYSRITSGKIVLSEKLFAVEGLVNNVVSVMKAQAQGKGLALEFNTRILGSGQVLGDAFRIKQILFNLLSNAIKFTDHGKVTLNVSTVVYNEKTEFNIVVKDTGKGIPAEDLDRIFNDFEQSENANSGVHFGSGLGLSIVKTICESMGGSIRVESKKGFGSVFKVNLPLKTAVNTIAEIPMHRVEATLKPFEGSVWIIDDDRLILGLCQNILDKYRIPYRCFMSPRDVLTTPWDPEVKTVLMDIRMPEMDGTQLNKELHKKINTAGVNVYACTAQVLPEEQEQILAQGFDGLLLKPFKEADLLHLLGIPPVEAQVAANQLTGVRQFAPDDEVQAHNIIALYTRDTTADIATLTDYYHAHDLENVELLLHRVAGRTAQIGADKIAFQLRKMEIDARNGDLPPETELQRALMQLDELMQQLQIQGNPSTVDV
ncbi:hybrid sensor histidine kinase/response regulator [Parapedobacter koreensis]|uniref:histidine kinase n=1 Tax=Parapedobacter koreensis TaxID=332977 RepID=A0A1H7L9Z4_9SPHI|nr:ATP-binding protein [Parapedobacter koreensis]SEK95792.1 Signal transduction histidine kinase [Parapedobacter koreensis]